MKQTRDELCGETRKIFYDPKVKNLNLELVSVKEAGNHSYFEIHLQDWSKRGKTLLRLHIKEAIGLKAVIDSLVYDALQMEAAGEIDNDKQD